VNKMPVAASLDPPSSGPRRHSAGSRVDTALWILGFYLLVTRVGHLEAAKLGVRVAGIPIFLTDFILLSLLIVSFARRPKRFTLWAASGRGLGAAASVVHLILVMAAIHFVVSVGRYGVLAARDLAIIGYALFFPVTLLSLRTFRSAERIIACMVVAGVALAVVLFFDYATGGATGLFPKVTPRTLDVGLEQSSYGSGDVGGFLAFSMVGALGWATRATANRLAWMAAAMVCGAAITLPQTRSALLGGAAGVAALVLIMGARKWALYAVLTASLLAASIALSPEIPSSVPGVRALQQLRAAAVSSLNPTGDANAQFRILRWYSVLQTWRQRPLVGVGFGKPLLPNFAPRSDQEGEFNQGMPHNTFLMILARTGVVGLGLYLAAISIVLARLVVVIRARLKANMRVAPALLAALTMIVAMVAYANFVLFFERPMHGAAFWILLASAEALTWSHQRETQVRREPLIAPQTS
jgi:O-antigen ligase